MAGIENLKRKDFKGIYMMKRQDFEDIKCFIDSQILDYDIDYDFEFEDDIMIVSFKGSFTNEEEINFRFRCNNGNTEFYGLCESYIFAETRDFWINFMTKIYE